MAGIEEEGTMGKGVKRKAQLREAAAEALTAAKSANRCPVRMMVEASGEQYNRCYSYVHASPKFDPTHRYIDTDAIRQREERVAEEARAEAELLAIRWSHAVPFADA
jgi:hypothetical protein